MNRTRCLCLSACLLLIAACLPTSAAPGAKPVRVGCYYFPGWSTADRWVPVVEYGGREPVLGCYRDASPAVQDWHIRQATQHGISFWVFDWYCDYHTATISSHNAALDDGFLHASLRSKMDFALMWCNEEAAKPDYTREQLVRLAETIGKRYLSQPNYLRVAGGRNVLVVSRPDRLVERFGVEGTRAALKEMSDAARAWGGFYFVGLKHPTVANLRDLRAAGFDACTLYCYAGNGMAEGQKEAPYSTILPAIEPDWRAASRSRELPIIPCVSPGWDSRPWYGENGLWRTGPTPELFGKMCRAMKECADPGLGLVVAGTWNEFGEGTYLEPTRERGCGMLDALQQAFLPGAKPHKLLQPAAAERAALDFTDIPAHLEEQSFRRGGNLVANPGFEQEWGWESFDGPLAQGTAGDAHSGRRAMVLAKTGSGIKTQVLSPGVPWPGRATNRQEVVPGRSYTVSAWVKGRAQVTLALFDKEGLWLRRYQPVGEGGAPGEWRKIEATVTIDDREAASFDLEVIALADGALVDDVGIWRR